MRSRRPPGTATATATPTEAAAGRRHPPYEGPAPRTGGRAFSLPSAGTASAGRPYAGRGPVTSG